MHRNFSSFRRHWLGAVVMLPLWIGACSGSPLSLGGNTAGAGGSASGGSGGSGVSGGSAGSAGSQTCDKAECGPALGLPNELCADGSVGGPTGRCLKNDNGSCGWEIRSCPPDGGAGEGNSGGSGSSDPCAGKTLPECQACPDGDAVNAHCGEACTGADSCQDQIGDGRSCVNGHWSCVIHAPLGTGCNLVCREPTSGAGGAGGAGGAPDCKQLLQNVMQAQAAAQACNPASAKPTLECAGALEGVCCPIGVELADPAAPANAAYLDALRAFKASCQQACPAIACFDPKVGDCKASSASSGTCAQ